jgi:hypothetical protein
MTRLKNFYRTKIAGEPIFGLQIWRSEKGIIATRAKRRRSAEGKDLIYAINLFLIVTACRLKIGLLKFKNGIALW